MADIVSPQDYETLLAIQQHGDLNPVQQTQLRDAQNYYGSNPPSNSGNSVTDLINSTIDSFTKQMNDYNNKLSAYDKANPFNFDDMLAKETSNVSARISPYYDQVMSDFMHGVNITRQRSLEDENNLVTELQSDRDAYTGNAKANLDTALLSTGQQASDSGGYDSGARARAQGVERANTAYDVFNKELSSNYQIKQAQLTGERLRNVDLPYQTGIEQRDINQQKTYTTQAQAYPQVQQDYAQWQYNRQQAAGNPPGVNPVSWQNSLSGLLPGVKASTG